jgi:hypothetical protein
MRTREEQLQLLAADYLEAKANEARAIAKRREIAKNIEAELMKPESGEGTVTEKLDGVKVSATFKVTRAADTTALQLDWNELPEAVRQVFYWKAEVSTTELRKLGEAEGREASKYITTKPAATAIDVTLN